MNRNDMDNKQRKRNSSLTSSQHQSRGSNRSLLLKSSNHSKKSLRKGSTHRSSSGRMHKTMIQYGQDNDNESVISSCSFGEYDDLQKQRSTRSLPVAPPPPTAMFSNQDLKLLYLSWDVIRNVAEGKKKLGKKLFELLSYEDNALASWFDTANTAHQTSLVEMIDMIVSMLSPTDLDVVSEELVSLGQRHAKHNEEIHQALLPSLFQNLTDAFCKALKECVHRHLFGGDQSSLTEGGGREKLMVRSSSQHSLFDDSVNDLEGKRPSNWKMVEHAWQDLFWYIRCQMEEGAMMEYQNQKYKEQQPPCTEIEYNVELKGDPDADEEDEEISLKGSKPWSFSSRRSSSVSTVSSSSASGTSHDSNNTGGTSKSRKKKTRRGLPKRLSLRFNSLGGSIRSSFMDSSTRGEQQP